MAASHLELVDENYRPASSPNSHQSNPQPIDGGGSGPHNPDMETRIANLERRADQAENRSERVEGKIDAMAAVLTDIRVALVALPTKRDLTANTWQIAAVATGAAALIVGGIIGGLGWIKPEDKLTCLGTFIRLKVEPGVKLRCLVRYRQWGRARSPERAERLAPLL